MHTIMKDKYNTPINIYLLKNYYYNIYLNYTSTLFKTHK